MRTKIAVFLIFVFASLKSCLSDCPSNSTKYQSKCFTFYNSSTGFADAELTCVNKIGGHLASIHDGFTNALISQEGTKHFHESTETDFWIGLTYLMGQKQWNWTDGTPFDFNDWKSGEPQNISGAGCVGISSADGYWSSQDCFKAKPFVCETTTEIYPVNANCSPGWSYFPPTGSCYGANFGGFVGNWTFAQRYCEDSQAFLPSIHSYAELQYITAFVYAAWYDFWLGISSEDGGRTWIGSDQVDVDFLKYGNWCPGYPLNVTGQICVASTNAPNVGGCYYERDCITTNMHTICKKPINKNS